MKEEITESARAAGQVHTVFWADVVLSKPFLKLPAEELRAFLQNTVENPIKSALTVVFISYVCVL